MHECPYCYQVCCCDGEDTWVSWPYNIDCVHACDDEDLEEIDFDDYEAWLDDRDFICDA